MQYIACAIYNDKKDNSYDRLYRIIDKICLLILYSDQSDITNYLKPLINSFRFSQNSYQLFSQFIAIEDRNPHYENFWYVWDQFFDKISDLCGNIDRNRNASETIKYYLLAHPYWNPGATEWHSIKKKEALFFERVVNKMGHASVVLYSIAKVLNEVGSQFQTEGVTWLSSMISAHEYNNLERYTIEYIETFIRRFVVVNKQSVRRDQLMKDKVVCILNFLFEHGSIMGFLLREEIL